MRDVFYLITYCCYGTWLHGDERGSVDRFHNQPGEPLMPPNVDLRNTRRRLMKGDAVRLCRQCQNVVSKTLCEVARHKKWDLQASNVLPNHVHMVISAPNEITPERIMACFKARSTRRLREEQLMGAKADIWAEHGSTRYLKSEISVVRAIDYVLNRQQEDGIKWRGHTCN